MPHGPKAMATRNRVADLHAVRHLLPGHVVLHDAGAVDVDHALHAHVHRLVIDVHQRIKASG